MQRHVPLWSCTNRTPVLYSSVVGTHPNLYPLHQSWRLFNELHQYDIGSSQWTQIHALSPEKPPAMAGHSATIHRGKMIVFGGLHKLRSSIGQFSSSNDLWVYDTESKSFVCMIEDVTYNTLFCILALCWQYKDIVSRRPAARYGQSQLKLAEDYILILGGCGGPNNVFSDVWLLAMNEPEWKWIECQVENREHGANHMWCHPAVK
jgi:F-box protein 42